MSSIKSGILAGYKFLDKRHNFMETPSAYCLLAAEKSENSEKNSNESGDRKLRRENLNSESFLSTFCLYIGDRGQHIQARVVNIKYKP
jgi:hypothetical protein